MTRIAGEGPARRWGFAAEAGVKVRFPLRGKQRLVALGYQLGGLRLGLRARGFDNLRDRRFIAEIGAGVW